MRRIWFALFLLLACFSAACRSEPRARNGHSASPAMVVSISSDGKFALTSHKDKNLIIWGIDQKKKKIISNNANIYSAYFIRGTNFLLWQDLDNIVRVQDINGETIKLFRHFPTYGHVFSSDLNTYVSCDAEWNLYLNHGEIAEPIKQDGESPSFSGQGKLLNLSISESGTKLLSAGRGDTDRDKKPLSYDPFQPDQIFSNYSGVIIWQLPSGRPVFKFPGHAAKTTAILSPDGKYVVSGCENGMIFVWNTETGKEYHEPASLFHGLLNKNESEDSEKWTYDKTGLIPTPPDLNSSGEATLAIRFIDENHYLRFLTYSPYAVLYHIDNPLPLKYLFLGRDPLPATSDYSRNAAIDTAPEAGILVMGQQNGGGIIVYQYHPVKQELERIWVGN